MTATQSEVIATLVFQGPDGWSGTYRLSSDNGVLVGTSDNCGLRLEGESVSAFHCFFSLENGQLWVQDWLSTSGTFVNDERIGAKVAVSGDDAVGVGEYRITTGLATSTSRRPPSMASPMALSMAPSMESQADEPQDALAAPSAVPCRVLETSVMGTERAPEGVREDVVEDGVDPEPLGEHDDRPWEPSVCACEDTVSLHLDVCEDLVEDALDQDEPSEEDAADDPVFDLNGSFEADVVEPGASDAAPPAMSFDSLDADLFELNGFEVHGFEAETIQLLRAEMEELQGELAQRDAQIAELKTQPPGDPAGQPEEPDEPSEALVARLEQLLDEAACHDERVMALEESLRTSDEANQAEREDRHQLEAWVADIERRIGQREAEWKAELDALRKRLEETAEERDRVERQLRQVASYGDAPEQFEETLERLRDKNQELHEQLVSAQANGTALERRLEYIERGNDQALREERAAISLERAMLSRLRAELTEKLAATGEQPRSREHSRGETTDRLQALRDHLRELHEQESHEPAETTLMSRISRLWKRLER